MNRRGFLRTAAAGAAAATPLAALLPGRARGADASAVRPNVVYFMTDDQRWDGLSVMGNPVVETPNMDRLGREGALFENMFVTNSLCAPSRACFLTGKYSHIHGVRTNRSGWTGQPVFVDHLRRAGYHTCLIGKVHQGANVLQDKFDLWLGFGGQGRYNDPKLRDFDGTDRTRQGHMTELLGDRAVAYLTDHRKDPFCLLVWFKSPHRAWEPMEKYEKAYADRPIPKPPTFDTDYRGKPSAIRHTEMQVEIAKGGHTFEEWMRDYYATIAGVDEQVGRVLATLDRLGLAEDTVVAFTGDNGFFLGEHHFFDKRLMYEPSIRVPMLVRWPRRIKAGTRVKPMCLNVDLAPTLLDVAGCEVPAEMQGTSWRPLLEGRSVPWRESWYYEYYEYPAVHMVRPNRGVRTERWKYIEWPEFHGKARGKELDWPAEYELYDLQADPHEVSNLYGEANHAAKVAELRAEMTRLRRELRDPDLET